MALGAIIRILILDKVITFKDIKILRLIHQ